MFKIRKELIQRAAIVEEGAVLQKKMLYNKSTHLPVLLIFSLTLFWAIVGAM